MSRAAAIKTLLLLLAVSAMLRTWTFVRPPTFDEGIYAYGGREWLVHGRPLYEATLGGKPPGIFAVYGAAMLVQPRGFTAIKVFGVILVALTAWFLALLGAELRSALAGLIAALAYVFVVSFRHGVDPPFVGAELLVAACVVPALLLMVKAKGPWGYLAAGLLAGVALQFRQTAVLDAAGLLAVSMLSFRETPIRLRSLYFMAGAAAVMAAVVAWFAVQGQLTNLVQGGWLGQFEGGYSGGHVNRLTGLRHIGEFAYANALFVALAVVAAAKVLPTMTAAGRRMMWIFVVASALSPLASGPRYGHHLIAVVPPLCFFAAIGLDWLLTRASGWSRRRQVAFVAIALILAVPSMSDAVEGVRCLAGPVREGFPPCPAQVLGRYIEAHTTPADTMMFLGEAGGSISSIYIFADRCAPTRFISHDLLSHRRALPEITAAFETRPPKWLVLDQSHSPEGGVEKAGSAGRVRAGDYITAFVRSHPYKRVVPPGTELFWAYELQPGGAQR